MRSCMDGQNRPESQSQRKQGYDHPHRMRPEGRVVEEGEGAVHFSTEHGTLKAELAQHVHEEVQAGHYYPRRRHDQGWGILVRHGDYQGHRGMDCVAIAGVQPDPVGRVTLDEKSERRGESCRVMLQSHDRRRVEVGREASPRREWVVAQNPHRGDHLGQGIRYEAEYHVNSTLGLRNQKVREVHHTRVRDAQWASVGRQASRLKGRGYHESRGYLLLGTQGCHD